MTERIRIRLRDGEWSTVEAEVFGEWAAHARVEYFGLNFGEWSVTHVPSGLRIDNQLGHAVASFEGVSRVAKSLADSGIVIPEHLVGCAKWSDELRALAEQVKSIAMRVSP